MAAKKSTSSGAKKTTRSSKPRRTRAAAPREPVAEAVPKPPSRIEIPALDARATRAEPHVRPETATPANAGSPVARRKTPAAAGAVREPPAGAYGVRDRREPVDLGIALCDAFLTNERVNQVLLDMINPRIWRVHPPSSRGRNIATSFAHIHNVRCMRLRMSAKDVAAPESLDRGTITVDEARWSLGVSARAMVALIERSLAAGGHVREYRPDVVGMVCAAISHEAHHRGQICHWLRELGSPLTPEQQLTLWEWDKRWKEVRRSR